MKSTIKIIALSCCCFIFLNSCRKDDPKPTETEYGKIYLEFFDVVGGSNLNLNNQWYKNENGDTFKVSKFNYYISNIKLNKADGSSFAEPNSYHLVEFSLDPSKMAFYIDSIPAGSFTSVTFMIGVDSAHNIAGAQTGDLDPQLGNFWSWNTGYIMMKFEGNSPSSPVTDGKLTLHAGGFSGQYNVLKTLTLDFGKTIDINKNAAPHIHLQADVLKLFKSPNVIDFSQTYTVMNSGMNAKMLSDNYADMFTITYAGL